MNSKNMNEVFILGSGFSKAVNKEMPLLNGLTEDVDLWFSKNKYKVKYYYDIYMKNIKSVGISNFEDILTFLYQDFPWKTDEEKHLLLALFIFISNLLEKILIKKQSETLENEIDTKKFLKYLHYNNSKVITFNYDTLLESLSIRFLKKHILRFTRGESSYNFPDIDEKIKTIYILEDTKGLYINSEDPVSIRNKGNEALIYFKDYKIPFHLFTTKYLAQEFHGNDKSKRALMKLFQSQYFDNILKNQLSYNDFYQMPIERLASRGTTIWSGDIFDKSYRLCKLHGSINLLYSNPEFGTGGQLFIKEGRKQVKSLENLYEKDLITLIIPPVFDKTNFLKIHALKILWQEAQNYIRNADKAYIIGYSLPESDLSVRLMLNKNLKDNCKIYIVNNDRNIVEKYEGLFYKNNLNYGSVCRKESIGKYEKRIIFSFYEYSGKKRKKISKQITLNYEYVRQDDNVFFDFVNNKLI